MPDKKKSAFDLADEQAARQRARNKRGPSKPPSDSKPSSPATVRRDYRGTRGAIDDAEGVSNPEDKAHKQKLREGMKKF